MRLDEIVRIRPACIIMAALVCTLCSVAALAQPDQDKLYLDLVNGWILYYTDGDGDLFHDPGEPFFPEPGGNDWNPDMSCWMASASNLLVFEGFVNPYDPAWLRTGGAFSPNITPWGLPASAAGGGAAMTFDDGGWQHWALQFDGKAFQGPIISAQECVPGTWVINPIDWCLARLAEGHAVGVTVWWGAPKKGRLPGRVNPEEPDGYHAITIYEINTVAGTVTITDSDDLLIGASGPRVVSYTYAGNDWRLHNLYPWGGVAHVNYAVALGEALGIKGTHSGTWNGEPFSAEIEGTANSSTGEVSCYALIYPPWPEPWPHPLWYTVGTTYMCIPSPDFAATIGGAVNFSDILGGTGDLTHWRTYFFGGHPADSVHATVSMHLTPDSLTFSGNWVYDTSTLPTDLVEIPEFDFFLTPIGDGLVQANGTLFAIRSNGDSLAISFTGVYDLGPGNNLPAAETETCDFQLTKVNDTTYTLGGTCSLRLTGVIPTLTEWGLIIFGVVLLGFITWVFLRRRRVADVRVG